jgi:demethylmenaquinone methyltransferase/2-methoxy-6-polyprenyl-1,4-benzoquinol methylase
MASSAAGPRAAFDCLWCGRQWSTRSPDDLEGWAQLCPDCLGRAGENPFLRFRLRDALAARASATRAEDGSGVEAGAEASADVSPHAGSEGPSPPVEDPDREMLDYYEARAGEYDDWYLRRGRYARGPIHDAAWNAELDGAGTWLDGLPIAGEIVELAAGTGWWSPLLAGKGELSIYDAAERPLERARDRLVAHRLRAHIHLRDAWAEPDRQVDALFAGFWLSHVPRTRTAEFLALAHRWLKPGGVVAFIDSLPDPQSGAADHPPTTDDLAVRRLDDGREFTIVKVYRHPDEIDAALVAAGFRDVRVTTTGRFFVLATGRA